jgi:hypothetical protein
LFRYPVGLSSGLFGGRNTSRMRPARAAIRAWASLARCDRGPPRPRTPCPAGCRGRPAASAPNAPGPSAAGSRQGESAGPRRGRRTRAGGWAGLGACGPGRCPAPARRSAGGCARRCAGRSPGHPRWRRPPRRTRRRLGRPSAGCSRRPGRGPSACRPRRACPGVGAPGRSGDKVLILRHGGPPTGGSGRKPPLGPPVNPLVPAD